MTDDGSRAGTPLARLDHLVLAGPDLSALSAEVAERLGVRPVVGGRHVGRGTRNELLGLGHDGPGAGGYLELIGPDPEQPEPDVPRPFDLDALATPRLVTWAVRCTDLAAASSAARAAGHDPGEAAGMQRSRPDGVLLSWRLTPTSPDGVLPFLIDWGGSPHPAADLPDGIRLEALELSHPEPGRVRAVLDAWGVGAEHGVEVTAGAPALRARLTGPSGELLLG
jgi:hypothetical protein